MIVLDYLLAFLYIVGIIILVVLVIVLAIPLGFLYGIYWLLLGRRRSKKRTRKKNKKSFSKLKGPKIDKSNIANIVNKALHAKDDESFDSKKFKEEVNEFVEQVTDVNNSK